MNLRLILVKMTLPLLNESIETRIYQQTTAATAVQENSLIVCPTGMGKTMIQIMITAYLYPKLKDDSFIVILAPTKPLITQLYEEYLSNLKIDPAFFHLLTGDMRSDLRKDYYTVSHIIFATPQTILNDINLGLFDGTNCGLVLIDEAHRGRGEYAYVGIVKHLVSVNPEVRINGFTASPGASKEEVMQIMSNLSLKRYEARMKDDIEMRDYVQDITFDWIIVPLNQGFTQLIKQVKEIMKGLITKLQNMGIEVPEEENKLRSFVLSLRQKLMISKDEMTFSWKEALLVVYQILYLSQMEEVIETQGIPSVMKQIRKNQREVLKPDCPYSLKLLWENKNYQAIIQEVKKLYLKNQTHPKVEVLFSELKEHLKSDPDSRVLIFANYRSTVKFLTMALEAEGIKSKWFVGQASNEGDKGLTQHQQQAVLNEFKEGEFQVLVSTSVAEEGLNIAQCRLVIFYDCVPSVIRFVQRMGRTGRTEPGRVLVLAAHGTRDEGYFWSARKKYRQMQELEYNTALFPKTIELDEKEGTVEIEETGQVKKDNSSLQALQPQDEDEDDQVNVKPVVECSSPKLLRDLRKSIQSSKLFLEVLENNKLPENQLKISELITIEWLSVEEFLPRLDGGSIFKSKREHLIIVGAIPEDILEQKLVNLESLQFMRWTKRRIFFVKDQKKLFQLLETILKEWTIRYKKALPKPLVLPSEFITEKEKIILALQLIFGLSGKVSEQIVTKFNNWSDFCSSSTDLLKTIPNIGEKTAAKIFSSFTKNWNNE
ncbi:MAG: helicase-related protein [Candidatus Kariarchaeaceae archaeon]